MSDRKLIEWLALKLVANEGIEAIWNLYTIAAEAHRAGHFEIAADFMEIADAAEREWRRRGG